MNQKGEEVTRSGQIKETPYFPFRLQPFPDRHIVGFSLWSSFIFQRECRSDVAELYRHHRVIVLRITRCCQDILRDDRRLRDPLLQQSQLASQTQMDVV